MQMWMNTDHNGSTIYPQSNFQAMRFPMEMPLFAPYAGLMCTVLDRREPAKPVRSADEAKNRAITKQALSPPAEAMTKKIKR